MLQAVEKRLRADVPVGAYLSGGVDSSMIAALACHLKGPAINTYTVRVDAPELDELSAANLVARHIGTKPPIVQEFGASDVLNTYPQLIQAAEAPVIDTSCAALLQLAHRVHACGQKVVLTGEGADEWLIGYPWYKAAKALGFLDFLPGLAAQRPRYAAPIFGCSKVPQYPPRIFDVAWKNPSAVPTPGLMLTGYSGSRNFAFTLRRCAKCWRNPIPGLICKFRWSAPNAGTR